QRRKGVWRDADLLSARGMRTGRAARAEVCAPHTPRSGMEEEEEEEQEEQKEQEEQEEGTLDPPALRGHPASRPRRARRRCAGAARRDRRRGGARGPRPATPTLGGDRRGPGRLAAAGASLLVAARVAGPARGFPPWARRRLERTRGGAHGPNDDRASKSPLAHPLAAGTRAAA
ncbi:unnamed protein product, partial [Prorocentrum cordatum]